MISTPSELRVSSKDLDVQVRCSLLLSGVLLAGASINQDPSPTATSQPLVACISQVALVVRDAPANEGDAKDSRLMPQVGKIPWSRKWRPALVFSPGKFHGQRSLVGYTVHGVAKSRTQLTTTSVGSPVPINSACLKSLH